MQIRIKVGFALIIYAVVLTTSTSAIDITTLDGDGADVFLAEQKDGGDGTAKLDHRLFMRTRDDTLARHEVTYLRFDLESFVSGSVTDVALEVFQLSGGNTDLAVYGLNDDPSEISSAWDETTITYNTAPGMNGTDGDTGTSDINLSQVTDLGGL